MRLASVEIELDAKLVVELLQKDVGNSTGNDVILPNCKEWLKRIPRVKIQHCFREANKCADALARRGDLMYQDFPVFTSPPADVELLISLDTTGTLYECVRSNVCFL
nr:putative ribonuclease h protein [Quercus suber]